MASRSLWTAEKCIEKTRSCREVLSWGFVVAEILGSCQQIWSMRGFSGWGQRCEEECCRSRPFVGHRIGPGAWVSPLALFDWAIGRLSSRPSRRVGSVSTAGVRSVCSPMRTTSVNQHREHTAHSRRRSDLIILLLLFSDCPRRRLREVVGRVAEGQG